MKNMAGDEFIFSKSLAKTNITSPIKENSIVIKIILLKLLNFYFLLIFPFLNKFQITLLKLADCPERVNYP